MVLPLPFFPLTVPNATADFVLGGLTCRIIEPSTEKVLMWLHVAALLVALTPGQQ
jgi:hypothetical protein